jgi:hypothetical protein
LRTTYFKFYHVVGGLRHFLLFLSLYSSVFLLISLFRLLSCYVCLVVVVFFCLLNLCLWWCYVGWLVVAGWLVGCCWLVCAVVPSTRLLPALFFLGCFPSKSFFPKQSLLYGVLTSIKAGLRRLAARASAITQNVAKTLVL